jgi:tRNA threonylcarbamoyl adenosine modification protein YeaZ
MMALVINTAGPQAVVYLVRDQDVLVRQEWTADRSLGKALLEVIENLLERYHIKPEDIDRIGVHGGPGHFGALRSGVSVASALATAWKTDLVQLSGAGDDEILAALQAAAPVAAIAPIYIKRAVDKSD